MLQLFKVLKIDAKLIFFQLATPRITDTRSRRLPDSTIWGVGDSPYQRYVKSATLQSRVRPFRLKNFFANSKRTEIRFT
jgi:hypothetical protein